MDISNLYLCVGITILMVALGVWNIHAAMIQHREAVKHEATGAIAKMMSFEEKSRGFENMGLALLFLCWLPCSNAAWITQASCTLAIQQMAETQRAQEPVNEIATKIARRDAVQAEYQVTLQNGATVSWSLNDVALSGVHRRGGSVNAGGSTSGTRIVGSPVTGSHELRDGTSDDGGIVWYGSKPSNGNQTF